MDKYFNAILWPVNNKLSGEDMIREEADVEIHIELANKLGAVYWDVQPKRKDLDGPFDGYLYLALPVGKVLYKCIVDHIINIEILMKMENEHKFIPQFRKQCLHGFFENGRKHKPSQTWIKMRDIKKLDKPLELSHFKKLDGTLVRNTHSGLVYIESPKEV